VARPAPAPESFRHSAVVWGAMTAVSTERAGDGFADLRLTEWTSCGGCAAKWGAALLKDLVDDFPAASDPALMIGLAPFDDAAIYRVSDDVAIVSTTDFFPPLVDHPDDFGAIAAANACSDVFAMGGSVVMAINIAAFPEHFPREAIAAIFAAAATVVIEAGGSVAGGHTIRNPEPIFGLAVQGVVHPDRVLRKAGARSRDVVVLSKPLGTGLTLAGGSDSDRAAAIAGMRALNRAASEQLRAAGPGVHAVTDVTGFGLAGHGWEVADRSGCRIVVDSSGLVAYPGAAEAAARGVRTGGDARNRDYLAGHLDSTAGAVAEALCFDPQTSGGLVAAVTSDVADTLTDSGTGWWRVGAVEPGTPALVLR
jgi:selenide, water dikinase